MSTAPWTRKERWAVGLLAVVTMIASAYGMMADMPETRLGIERLHIQLALKYGMGDLNPHFFIHPPLLSYLLFGLYGMVFLMGRMVGALHSVAEFEQLYFTDPTLFYVLGRSVMLCAAAGSVVLFARIGRRLFGTIPALSATALVACAPVLIKWAHYALPTILMLCLFLASFSYVVRIFEGGRRWDYLAAGLLGGLATAAKYDGGLILVPYIVAHVLAPRHSAARSWWNDWRWLEGVACFGLAFFMAAPFTFLDAKNFLRGWAVLKSNLIMAYHVLPGWRIDKPGWLFIWTDALPFGWTGPVTLVGFLGVIDAICRRGKADWLLLSGCLVAFVLISRWQVIDPRYFLTLFPFAILLGVRSLVEWMDRAVAHAVWRRVILGGVVILCLAVQLREVVAFNVQVARPPLGHIAKAWIEATVPPGTALSTTLTDLGLTPTVASVTRDLEEVERKHLGRAVRLRRLLQHVSQASVTYDVHVLPTMTMDTYDEDDFDFHRQVTQGVRYFVLHQEVEDYQGDPEVFHAQLQYVAQVKRTCQLVWELRRPQLPLERPMRGTEEYVQIYQYFEARAPHA